MGSDAFAEPRRIATLLAGFAPLWGIAGGWAIDLFLHRVTRPHHDVDVAILRGDQKAIYAYLEARGWTLEKAIAGDLIPWMAHEHIELPAHTIWCRNPAHTPDFVEILFNEAAGDLFLFRRDPAIRLPMHRAFITSRAGLPILAPEVALLYKSNNPDLPKNAADFHHALPALAAEQRAWLAAALRRTNAEHPWLARMDDYTSGKNASR
jgi:hypothetical protein